MSQSQSLSVILDDSRSDSFVFGPTQWTRTTFPEWYNGSAQTAQFASGGNGTVQLKFEGTSVALFGLSPAASNSHNFMVSVDGSAPTPANYSDPNPPSYRQWYQSPQLSEGTHNLFLSQIAGATVDFATVTVGQRTALTNQLVIADNDDPGFTFDGKWKRSQAQFNSGPRPDGNAYHNSTHQTSNIGDTFTYRFAGGSLYIYGIFTWSYLGSLTLSFTLDGQPLSQTFKITTDTPQFKSELGQQQNFLFKSFDFLSPGNHTLVVNVTDCVNQTFAFDYLTYSPSFVNLAAMPNLTQPAATGATNTPASASSKKSIVGPLAGGLIGGILLLALVLLFIIMRRRRSRKTDSKPITPFPQRDSILSNNPTPRTIASFFPGAESSVIPTQHQAYAAPLSDKSAPVSPVFATFQRPPHAQPTHHQPDLAIGGRGEEALGDYNSQQNATIGSPPSYEETTR